MDSVTERHIKGIFFCCSFRTLVNPTFNGRGQQYVSDYRRPGGGGGNPPPPAKRRMGGFATLASCQAPMPGGG